MVLIAILLLALAIRLATIGFGLPALYDPDELMFEMGAVRMLRGLTLDPGWFGHPATTTMYVLALVDVAAFGFAFASGRVATLKQFGDLVYYDPSWLILPARIVMTLFALGTIWLTWRLAARLFGRHAGWIAALLLALDPLHVTYSQIIRSDMMACFFMLLCLEAACRIAEGARWRDYAWAAVWLGLAVATKWPFALAGIGFTAAGAYAARRGVRGWRESAVQVAAAWLGGAVALLLVSPFLLIDRATVARNLQGEKQLYHLGATGGGPLDNLWWYLSGPIYTGLGAVGLALLVIGAVRLPRYRLAFVILVPVATAFIVLFCLQHLVWDRWALPLMPLGAIVAALGFVTLGDVLRRSSLGTSARYATAGLLLLVTLLPLMARVRGDGVARMNDTRQQASAWIAANVRPGSNVLIEHFAFDLLRQPVKLRYPMGEAGCIDVQATLAGKISYATIEAARSGRAIVDYGTMPPVLRASCPIDVAILTQAARYHAERAHFAAPDAAYQALIARGTIAATFRPVPGQASGPVVDIVVLHPTALR